MTDKRMGEFEAWFLRYHRPDWTHDGFTRMQYANGMGYAPSYMQAVWKGWQASRAVIDIDIPSSCDSDYWIDDVFQRVKFERDVEKAIIAAGLKVKRDGA